MYGQMGAAVMRYSVELEYTDGEGGGRPIRCTRNEAMANDGRGYESIFDKVIDFEFSRACR